MASRLTRKRERFAAEYVIDLNATKAAGRAGYSPKTAKQQGARLLTNVDVKTAVGAEQEKHIQKLEITAERVIQELARVAFFDPRKLFDADGRCRPITELDDDTAMAIAGMKTVHKVTGEATDGMVVFTDFKLADKGAALERLGRYFKLFTDKLEVSASGSLAEAIARARERAAEK